MTGGRYFIDTSTLWGDTGGGQGLFIDGGSGDSTTSDGLDRLE